MSLQVSNIKEVRRWVIIKLDITSSNQIIRIANKLPSHIKTCKGIMVSICDYLNVSSDINQIGELSLMLNSGQTHPYHFMTTYSKNPVNKCNKTLEINETLIPNQTIAGFYKDLGMAKNSAGYFLPYSINIYLDCRK